jgi:hypothetical protein
MSPFYNMPSKKKTRSSHISIKSSATLPFCVFILNSFLVLFLGIRCWACWVLVQDALLNQFLRRWAMRNLLVQAVSAHMLLKLFLLRLDTRSCTGRRKDVSYILWMISSSSTSQYYRMTIGYLGNSRTFDKVLLCRALFESFLEAVGDSLLLERMLCALDTTVYPAVSGTGLKAKLRKRRIANSRCSISIEENVSVLQFFGCRPVC